MEWKKHLCDWICNYKPKKGKEVKTKLNPLQNKLDKALNENQRINNLLEDYRNIKPINQINPTSIPIKKITYQRPVLIAKEKWTIAQIDVRNFITANDYHIQNEIKKNKLFYTGEEDLDKLIPKLYKLAKKNYKYAFDNQFGFSEYWMFPFETRAVRAEGKGADCDDWAIKIGSYFATARIPSTDWFISAGYTRSKIGHATVYAKSSDEKFNHLNSTNQKNYYNDLKKFPSKNDSKDKIGIHPDKFWFSFNDKFAINKFETSSAVNSFNKEKTMGNIKIK